MVSDFIVLCLILLFCGFLGGIVMYGIYIAPIKLYKQELENENLKLKIELEKEKNGKEKKRK